MGYPIFRQVCHHLGFRGCLSLLAGYAAAKDTLDSNPPFYYPILLAKLGEGPLDSRMSIPVMIVLNDELGNSVLSRHDPRVFSWAWNAGIGQASADAQDSLARSCGEQILKAIRFQQFMVEYSLLDVAYNRNFSTLEFLNRQRLPR